MLPRIALALTLFAPIAHAQDMGVPGAPIVVPADKVEAAPAAAAPRLSLNPSAAQPASQQDAELRVLDRMVATAKTTVAAEIAPPPPEITVEPGRNEVIPIARGHLNRFVTPFATPLVKSTSDAVTNVDGQILYVATEDTRPITLYVMDESAPEQAMSLTLMPREILPVQVKLFLAGNQPPKPVAAKAAVAWETGQPYVETIKQLFRALALGQVPPGYGLNPMHDGHSLMPQCRIPGIDVRPAQVLEGGSIITFVARAVNATIDPIEIDESGCAAKGVLAVAAWPHTLLEPGGETELYIAVRRPNEREVEAARPSVLRARSH